MNGPNGIEYVNGKLLVAVSPDRLVTIDLTNTSFPAIVGQFPADGIQGCDGIIFDAAKEKLYIAGFGTEGSVLVASSNDEWVTTTVHTAYSAACVNDGTTTLAIASNSDVMALCTNNFGPAPYAISVLTGVVSANHFEMSTSSRFSTASKYPEGIEYDSNLNQLVLSSQGKGGAYGLPPSFSGAVYSDVDVFVYNEGSSEVAFYLSLIVK